LECSRTRLALEVGENLRSLIVQSGDLLGGSTTTAGAAHAASAASAAADAAIDAAAAAARAAAALEKQAAPAKPPRFVGDSELRFVGGFIALDDDELEALDESARRDYDQRQRTHERVLRLRGSGGGGGGASGGQIGGSYLGYGGGRSNLQGLESSDRLLERDKTSRGGGRGGLFGRGGGKSSSTGAEVEVAALEEAQARRVLPSSAAEHYVPLSVFEGTAVHPMQR
jgi:hypothetical protein